MCIRDRFIGDANHNIRGRVELARHVGEDKNLNQTRVSQTRLGVLQNACFVGCSVSVQAELLKPGKYNMDSNFRFWYVFFGRNSKRRNIQRRAMPHFPLTTAGDFCQSNFSGFTHTQHEKFRFLDSSSAIKMLDILFSKETVVLCRWESEIWKFGFAPCKVIQESLRFRIPRCRFRIPWLWIPDSISMDFVFHNQQPGFWITIMAGFRIPLAGFRISKPWIPDSTDQNYLDSGFRITLHAAKELMHFWKTRE